MTVSNLKPEEYQAFRDFLEKSSGIVLGENKHYLVTSRLSGIMQECSIPNFSALMDKLLKDQKLKQKIMDAMTTNETSWFRDTYPYDILREKILPEAAKRKVKRFKIWSAACSTGQEPYSISMVASDYMLGNPGGLPTNSIEIIGTDISSAALQIAKQGQYEGVAVTRGLSPERKQRFFKENGQHWQITPEIKSRVSFREMNLMQSYALLGKFDVIFCRNVLIYFSPDLKKDIISRMAQALNPNGYLILGGSESISGYSEAFELIRWKNGVIYSIKSKTLKAS